MNSTTFSNDIAIARYIARTKPDLKLYGENVLQSTEVTDMLDYLIVCRSTLLVIGYNKYAYSLSLLIQDGSIVRRKTYILQITSLFTLFQS